MTRAGIVVAAVVSALALAGSAGTTTTASSASWNAWLCMPGTENNWCSVRLNTDVFYADGRHRVVEVSVPANPPVDCFYVYPTVSEQLRGNADLKVHAEQRETAITQAARFSHACRVYAPLYRQTTAWANRSNADYELPYKDVLAAWKTYLAEYNRGRGVVLIGHSQGAWVLTRLVREEIDDSPARRKLLVSALLLGGDVQVARGSTVGGHFVHIPACTSKTATACVVAYDSWGRTPPKNAGPGVNPSRQSLCVNPAAPGGGSAPITPIFAGINPQGIVPYGSRYVTYNWVEFPGLYTARCVRDGGRAWLLVSRIAKRGDKRPTAYAALGAERGLHAADVNIALGDLVDLVGSQSRAWLRGR